MKVCSNKVEQNVVSNCIIILRWLSTNTDSSIYAKTAYALLLFFWYYNFHFYVALPKSQDETNLDHNTSLNFYVI